MIDVKNKKILVTGGAGFIGSAMVRYLLGKNCTVRAIDVDRQISINPLPENVEVVKGSILDVSEMTNAMEGCSYVIHMAAALGVKRTENERLGCLQANIQGTVNVLEACVRDNIEKIVFPSSSEVYGDSKEFPISEQNALNPKSIYATTKLAGEEYLKAYNQRYALNYSVARLFNVYGPRQNREFVVTRFIENVLYNKPPVIYGDGQQIRSFCYIDDIAEGLYLALLNEKANGEIINLGNNSQPVTIEHLAKTIIEIMGENRETRRIDIEDSDRTAKREIYKRIPDISKARKILGYKPKYSLEEGVKKTVEWWRRLQR